MNVSMRMFESNPFTKLLNFVGSVNIPEITDWFVARDRFISSNSRDAPVVINYIGESFATWFLSGDGKIEKPISEPSVLCHKVQKHSVDVSIISELGGCGNSETTLAEMYALMEKQRSGVGLLVKNKKANIFYVRDSALVLRVVFVNWFHDGWHVNAHPVECSNWWHVGCCVFSRNYIVFPT